LCSFSIRLAEWDQSTKKDCDPDGDCVDVQEQNIKIAGIFPHEQYNATTYLNDIALIRLEKPAEYNAFVKPICLPYTVSLRSHNLLDDKEMWVTGWGTTESSW
jgi:secreted trypsin-like serine protease